jgi:hypothetical protein
VNVQAGVPVDQRQKDLLLHGVHVARQFGVQDSVTKRLTLFLTASSDRGRRRREHRISKLRVCD